MIDRYAVFGNPIAHSKSPLIHAAFAQSLGHTIEYTTKLVPVDGFATALNAYVSSGAKGANVTLPFKIEACTCAHRLHDRARIAQAANCLKFDGHEIIAENFDGIGMVRDIERNHRTAIGGSRVLVLGAGGAARGILQPLIESGAKEIVVWNRTAEKARSLSEQFDRVVPTAQLTADIGAFDMVVNATSTALSDQDLTIPASVFAPRALAYELAYGKGLTPFLRQAQAAGVTHLADGVGMLIEQAAEAYQWWRGQRPQTQALIERFSVPLVSTPSVGQV